MTSVRVHCISTLEMCYTPVVVLYRLIHLLFTFYCRNRQMLQR